MAFVAVSNHGGGIAKHLELTGTVTDLALTELPESLTLRSKITVLRAALATSGTDLVVTHGVAAGLAARHRGRAKRQVRHVEFCHSDAFFLTPKRRHAWRVLARTGYPPDVQVFVARWLIEKYRDGRTKDVRVLANSVPVGERDASPRVDRRAVFMGRLSPEKGYEELLKAWPADSVTRGWGLDVFGDGPLVSLPAPAGVTLKGQSARPMQELGSCDLVIIPSRTEASPYVGIEAQAVATPLVATAAGDLPHLLKSGCGWSAPVSDTGALQEAILAAQSSSPDELTLRGKLGQQWLARERPFEQWQRSIADLYGV